MVVLVVQRLGFLTRDMKQLKKSVRKKLRTFSLGFTLVEMLVVLVLQSLFWYGYIAIIHQYETVSMDTFTTTKLDIRASESVMCLNGKLFYQDIVHSFDCINEGNLIKIFVEGKIFYEKIHVWIYPY